MGKKNKPSGKKKAGKNKAKPPKQKSKPKAQKQHEPWVVTQPTLLTQEFVADVFATMDPQLTNQQKGYVRKGLNAIIFAISCAKERVPDTSGATEGLIAAFEELDDDLAKMSLSVLHLIMINPAAVALVRKRSGCFGKVVQENVNEFYRAALLMTLGL